jgi:hypothetical protein
MALVSARHSSRGAFLFVADRASHPARSVIKSRIPSAESEFVRSCPPFMQARFAFQVEDVLAEFVAQLFDLEIALKTHRDASNAV